LEKDHGIDRLLKRERGCQEIVSFGDIPPRRKGKGEEERRGEVRETSKAVIVCLRTYFTLSHTMRT